MWYNYTRPGQFSSSYRVYVGETESFWIRLCDLYTIPTLPHPHFTASGMFTSRWNGESGDDVVREQPFFFYTVSYIKIYIGLTDHKKEEEDK